MADIPIDGFAHLGTLVNGKKPKQDKGKCGHVTEKREKLQKGVEKFNNL